MKTRGTVAFAKGDSRPGVYFLLQGTRVLYVGGTQNLGTRVRCYFGKRNAIFFDRVRVLPCSTRGEARIAEADALHREKPPYNANSVFRGDATLRNTKLRNAVYRDGRADSEIAKAANMHGSALNMIVAGYKVATPKQVAALCRVLGVTRAKVGL